jgi:hypothetical protein
MADLRRTPSVQHAVALMRETVQATVLEMEKLDAAKITISLDPGRRMFKPIMEGQPIDWAIRQLKLEKREQNIAPNIGLVEAFEPYARGKSVAWFRKCQAHFYPIGSGVIIPVRPAGFWAESGKLRVLWPQCWKGRTLDPLQRAIFHTILIETFFVGDFKGADLEWVDLREQMPRKGRDIEVLPGDALGTVSRGDLAEYLGILRAAFDQHTTAKTKQREAEKAVKKSKPGEAPLFGDDLPENPRP